VVVSSAEWGVIWTVQTGLPGERARVRLHQAYGFRVVGDRRY
jgi:hypothetical protein